MRNPFEVLQAKEQELAKVKREIEALRVALPLLGEEEESGTPGRSIFGPSLAVPRAVPLP
ncbi:MAG TPA: hypothetical protein VMU61_04980 [Candidatus Aquilonibacter sp.]|nr:hypothetical protein [Candidatus Aquilonibacter sp.]